MKTAFRLCICALVLTALSATFTYADDTPAKTDDAAKKPADAAPKAADAEKKVENPEYKNWAQFKPGAFSTMKMTTSTPMGGAEVTVTQTLKSITPEKAVIEFAMVQKMMGQETKMPPQTREVPAQVTEAEAQKKLTPPRQDRGRRGDVDDPRQEAENKVGGIEGHPAGHDCSQQGLDLR